jgi:hypothetical protein
MPQGNIPPIQSNNDGVAFGNNAFVDYRDTCPTSMSSGRERTPTLAHPHKGGVIFKRARRRTVCPQREHNIKFGEL